MGEKGMAQPQYSYVAGRGHSPALIQVCTGEGVWPSPGLTMQGKGAWLAPTQLGGAWEFGSKGKGGY